MGRVLEPQTVRQGVREFARLRREGLLRERAAQLLERVRAPETLGQRAAVNSGWLMGEQLVRMAITFAITVLIIRHLGPNDYGILAYGIALVLIIDVVAMLGMRSVMVREIVNHPDQESEILGTAIALRLLGSVIIAALVLAAMWSVDADSRTLAVLLVLSLGLPLWSLTGIELLFQARLQSQYTFYARVAGMGVASVLRVGLLVAGAPLLAFAAVAALELAATGLAFALLYRARHAALSSLRVRAGMARRLLSLSWPLFISALAATVYLKVDQVMLMHFAGPAEVGIYAAGARISEVWHFIPIAIASSLLPVFVAKFNEGGHAYRPMLQRGFDVACWSAIGLAVAVTLAAPLVVFLYGADFERTVDILRIHVWAAPFFFMSNVLSRALITEDRRKFELTRHSSGAVLNIALNLVLIPLLGGIGAAIATVVSYSFSSYLICFAYGPARTHAYLMTAAIALPLRRRGPGDMQSRWVQDDRSPRGPTPEHHQDGHKGNGTGHAQPAARSGTASVTIEVAEPREPAPTNGALPALETLQLPSVPEPSRVYLALKRVVDVTVAAVLLVLLAPLMAVLAVAIKLTSPGPVFFKQERCGLRGRRFHVLKFRSMRPDAESRRHEVQQLDVTNGPTFKSPVDPRVTAVGRFMRRYSLDETPQLWHVLTGDMSLVGPRPLITQETLELPEWALARLAAKPGLTCIWQVSGRSLIPFEEWMQLDLEYVQHRSLWLDLKLLMKTPAAVLSGRGAF